MRLRVPVSVLLTLAAGQFVMALDTTVMNTAIATVARDVGTDVTGIQTAITLYTLVMASLMITGGKIGEIIGRKRAFSIGCVIYACGSLTTALAHSLTVLIIGWSFLEGFGAVLIMPAIVALVATNFGKSERPRAYGLVAAAAAIAAALGPVIGGAFTTYASWRWVFVGEVLIVLVILALARRVNDSPAQPGVKLDLVGTALSALGLGLIVIGVLKSGAWGLVQPKPDAPQWLGLSPVIWLVLGGGVVMALFVMWENRRINRGEGALIDPTMLRNIQLRDGVIAFFFMFLVQAGTFFVVPLFLSVALGLSAIQTGVRLLPLSLTLLLFAIGVPKLRPQRVTTACRAARIPGVVRRVGAAGRVAGRRRRPRDRDLAPVDRRLRPRRNGVTTRQRDRLGSPRRAKRRGRRPTEHRHPTWRLNRHRPRGRDSHLSADRVLPDRHPEQPRRPPERYLQGTDQPRRWHPVHVGQRSKSRTRERPRSTRDRGCRGQHKSAKPHRRTPRSTRSTRADRAHRTNLHPRPPHRPARYATRRRVTTDIARAWRSSVVRLWTHVQEVLTLQRTSTRHRHASQCIGCGTHSPVMISLQ